MEEEVKKDLDDDDNMSMLRLVEDHLRCWMVSSPWRGGLSGYEGSLRCFLAVDEHHNRGDLGIFLKPKLIPLLYGRAWQIMISVLPGCLEW